ncbi:ABC transporter permease [Flavobacterium sp. 102]|uniref:ABC transporter permease n=1 Tax=Flavobacterium sp. 102 TaxID=2135623 RepID=UPI000EAD4EA4|nr:ABC transporter permease [Flavobacterium sp. 102]RKS01422.1 putative ABC transport system permease protein [Flavobacterium sp. 102]
MIKNWLHIFLFQIKNNKLFTALNVLGLSIGIAGLIFAILYWNDEQSYNDWNPEKDTVFQSISQVSKDMVWASNVAAFEPYFKKSFPELEAYCYLENWYYEEIVQYKSKKEILRITDAQNTFFEFFPFNFSKGSAKTALKDNNAIAISEDAAARLFGSDDPMGKEVRYSGRTLVVRGVYTIPGKSSMAPMAVTNLIEPKLKENANHWGNFNHGLLLKFKNPADKDKVISRMEKILFENRAVKWAKDEGITLEEWIKKNGSESTGIILEPLANARLHSVVDGYAEGRGNYQFLLIMVGLSILILILSIVNYINLATANAIKRAKEVGVRKILGASKVNIIKQFIFETTLITLFSILLALVIVELSLPYYNEFLNKKLIIHGEQFYLQLIGIFFFTIAVAGVFPAFYVANFETLKVLKGNFGRSKSGVWLRNGMLILQFSIATFFIIGSYIVYQQVQHLNTKDLGFKGEQVLSVRYRNTYDWREKDYMKKLFSRYYTIKNEVSKIKGVEQVSTGSFSFGGDSSSSSSFEYNEVTIQGQNMGIDFGMLEMMKIQLKEGRYLSDKFASDTINAMLVNETTLKMMKEKNPIGKEVEWNGKKLKIVGVVKDFNLFSPQSEVPPMVFFHFKTIDWMLGNASRIHVKVNGENMEQTIADIEKFWLKNVDNEYPFEYDFVDKAFARTFETYVKQRNLFSLLNFIVILIALFGLFALASYSIQRRMKEIAIRKTLGAETAVLLKELSKQYIIFCLIGFAIALFPVYYLLNKWLENFAYRIEISFIPFVVGFIVLLILTLIVVLSRAYQATRLDVLKYLKYE